VLDSDPLRRRHARPDQPSQESRGHSNGCDIEGDRSSNLVRGEGNRSVVSPSTGQPRRGHRPQKACCVLRGNYSEG
jgi:hypothetical protein